MAQPTVMVSSTFYDLKQVRDDLRTFIENDLGYNAMLSELPSFPIDPSLDTVENCRLNVKESADILVLVIGGRHGTVDIGTDKSVTNLEYEEARLKRIPVYAFVDRGVLANLDTWQANPDADFSRVVSSSRVFEFIDQVRSQDRVWMYPFETANDIIVTLRLQFAILFNKSLASAQRIVGTGVPEWYDGLSPTALKLVIERPDYWEYLVFFQVWLDEIAARTKLYREFEAGLHLRVPEPVQLLEATTWLQAKFHEISGIASSATALLNDQVPMALKEDGVEADAEHLVWVARYLGRAYEQLLEWNVRLRCAYVEGPFEEVVEEAAKLARQLIDEMRKFPGESLSKIEAVVAHPDVRQEVELTMEFTEPDVDGFSRALGRAEKRLADLDF